MLWYKYIEIKNKTLGIAVKHKKKTTFMCVTVAELLNNFSRYLKKIGKLRF